MANHKSALKRIRQSERRRKRNQHIRSGMRSEVKRFEQALQSGDADQASQHFATAERAIRKAATKGVIPRQRADRRVSRLAKALNALRAS